MIVYIVNLEAYLKMEFSNRISTLKPSAIREILKIPNDPELISFAAGNPAPDSFPVDAMSRIAATIFESRAANALQYGVSEGYTPLRDITKKRMSEKYGILSENDINELISFPLLGFSGFSPENAPADALAGN